MSQGLCSLLSVKLVFCFRCPLILLVSIQRSQRSGHWCCLNHDLDSENAFSLVSSVGRFLNLHLQCQGLLVRWTFVKLCSWGCLLDLQDEVGVQILLLIELLVEALSDEV